jgi:hypothetical protein
MFGETRTKLKLSPDAISIELFGQSVTGATKERLTVRVHTTIHSCNYMKMKLPLCPSIKLN